MLYFIYICLSIYLVTKSDHTGQLFPLGGFVFFLFSLFTEILDQMYHFVHPHLERTICRQRFRQDYELEARWSTVGSLLPPVVSLCP